MVARSKKATSNLKFPKKRETLNATDRTLVTLEQEQLKYMRSIARSNRTDQVVLRGCMMGIFSAIGTTVGFALLLVLLTGLLAGVKDWPVVDQILAQTKLDTLIENQINRLSGYDGNLTASGITYSDEINNVNVTYPTYLNNRINLQEDDQDQAYLLILEGSGALNSLEIYFNEEPSFDAEGAPYNEHDVNFHDQQKKYRDYYEGGTVADTAYTRHIFYFQGRLNGIQITLIGIAGEDTPRIGREVFAQVVGNIGLATELVNEEVVL